MNFEKMEFGIFALSRCLVTLKLIKVFIICRRLNVKSLSLSLQVENRWERGWGWGVKLVSISVIHNTNTKCLCRTYV
jgi:hypothetical protein